MDNNELKFPIGEFKPRLSNSSEELDRWITDIESFPEKLDKCIEGITSKELNSKYRPGGWNVKEVIHHCADSHINSLIRFKLALTEDTPTVKPYFEDRWAKLVDSQDDDISFSILIIKGVHQKLGMLLRNLTTDQLKSEFFHPQMNIKVKLEENIGIYAWHSNHHLEHVKIGIKSGGKYN